MNKDRPDRLCRSLLTAPLLAASPSVSMVKKDAISSTFSSSQQKGNRMIRTLLLKNVERVVCMNDSRREIGNGSIFIKGDEIDAAGAAESLSQSADEVIHLRGHIVVPGLINAHHHMYQSLTRVVPSV